MTSIHTRFATRLVAKHDALLLNDGPDEQASRVLQALQRASTVTALTPVADTEVDLAGFGTAPIVYASEGHDYVLLSDVADALGWPLHKADAWARLEHGFAIKDQRDRDEERGDGRLGWDLLLDYIDLHLDLVQDDPEARPDAGGRRWSFAGDWLVSTDRLPLLLACSPWGQEFVNNALPAFGHAMREVWGDKLKDIPAVTVDGTPTGGNAFDDLFSTDGLTKGEALRRARRGPTLDEDGGTR
ncbi:hypothetical protein [Streptomyces sp. CC228A]|uniref:hypothetical protein n=1 Tax=Streptomyces sp. CC228A TaxID=2898186 RepID=UPI001F1E6D5A|nr:hypothetical protein [Streptomyces sp. CC228A]